MINDIKNKLALIRLKDGSGFIGKILEWNEKVSIVEPQDALEVPKEKVFIFNTFENVLYIRILSENLRKKESTNDSYISELAAEIKEEDSEYLEENIIKDDEYFDVNDDYSYEDQGVKFSTDVFSGHTDDLNSVQVSNTMTSLSVKDIEDKKNILKENISKLITSGVVNPEFDIETLAKLRLEMQKIEKEEIRAKLNEHSPSGMKEVSYGLPGSNIKIKGAVQYPGKEIKPKNNRIG